MFKATALTTLMFFCLAACTDNKDSTGNRDLHWVALRTDTINVVGLQDTLVIYQSVCRGCAYEGSTHFDVVDTSGNIQLTSILTHDDNHENTDGGSISKNLLLLASRTGTAEVRLYRFNTEQPTAEDSAKFTTYQILVNPK